MNIHISLFSFLAARFSRKESVSGDRSSAQAHAVQSNHRVSLPTKYSKYRSCCCLISTFFHYGPEWVEPYGHMAKYMARRIKLVVFVDCDLPMLPSPQKWVWWYISYIRRYHTLDKGTCFHKSSYPGPTANCVSFENCPMAVSVRPHQPGFWNRFFENCRIALAILFHRFSCLWSLA